MNRKGIRFTVKIDKRDLLKLIELNRRWNVDWGKDAGSYYVVFGEYKPEIKRSIKHYLHRFIYDYPEGMVIDHINNNTLDNRRENLRITKQSDNLKNRKGKNSNNKSGYRNVCWISNEQKWVVQIMIEGKNTEFGKFDNVDEAGEFAKIKRDELYGDFSGNS